MEYLQNYPLEQLNSFKTKAFAKLYCQPKTVKEIQEVLLKYPQEQKIIIGEGCNMFFTKNFDGLVIHPNIKGIREAWDDKYLDEENDIYIEVNASENWDKLVAHCVNNGFAGLENLSMIPGTVGASPVQNIGAYGSEVKDVIREVVAIDKETGEVISFNNTECQFEYRNSIFKRTQRYIIVSVVFHLERNYQYKPKYAELNKALEEIENPTPPDVREAVIAIRKRKLPDEKQLPNAGSFFKNPYITAEKAALLSTQYENLPQYPQTDGSIKTSAAFLIDKAGFKNKRIGNIGTYPTQPLVIVNYGTSDGNEIVEFMHEVQKAVSDTFGIELEPEVWIY